MWDNFISIFVLWAAVDFQPVISVGCPFTTLNSEKMELVLNVFIYFNNASPWCTGDIAAGAGGRHKAQPWL